MEKQKILEGYQRMKEIEEERPFRYFVVNHKNLIVTDRQTSAHYTPDDFINKYPDIPNDDFFHDSPRKYIKFGYLTFPDTDYRQLKKAIASVYDKHMTHHDLAYQIHKSECVKLDEKGADELQLFKPSNGLIIHFMTVNAVCADNTWRKECKIPLLPYIQYRSRHHSVYVGIATTPFSALTEAEALQEANSCIREIVSMFPEPEMIEWMNVKINTPVIF